MRTSKLKCGRDAEVFSHVCEDVRAYEKNRRGLCSVWFGLPTNGNSAVRQEDRGSIEKVIFALQLRDNRAFGILSEISAEELEKIRKTPEYRRAVRRVHNRVNEALQRYCR